MATIEEQVSRNFAAMSHWSDDELKQQMKSLTPPPGFIEAEDEVLVGQEGISEWESTKKVRRFICRADNRKVLDDALKDGINTSAVTLVVTWLLPIFGIAPGLVIPVSI